MDSEQKQRILDIVSDDCKAKGKYITYDGQTCAIGALLEDTGFDMSYFQRKIQGETYNERRITSLPKALRHLREVFGLKPSEAMSIQTANDSWYFNDTVSKRRQRVKSTIETL